MKTFDDFYDPRAGEEMHAWARELWPIFRSLTGPGVRQTLHFFQEKLPGLQVQEVPSGTHCFDWEVPPEWSVTEAH
jgi:aminopeptidase-like protein